VVSFATFPFVISKTLYSTGAIDVVEADQPLLPGSGRDALETILAVHILNVGDTVTLPNSAAAGIGPVNLEPIGSTLCQVSNTCAHTAVMAIWPPPTPWLSPTQGLPFALFVQAGNPPSGGCPSPPVLLSATTTMTLIPVDPTNNPTIVLTSNWDNPAALCSTSGVFPTDMTLSDTNPPAGFYQWQGMTDLRFDDGTHASGAPVVAYAGTEHFIQVDYKEGRGNDHFSVAVRLPGDPPPAIGSVLIPDSYFIQATSPPVIVEQPQDVTTEDGSQVKLRVAALGAYPFKVQWYVLQYTEVGLNSLQKAHFRSRAPPALN
jgi:hypothetical protein